MPILHIDIIGEPDDYPIDLAQRIADSAGAALASRPQGTWVKLRFVRESAYAENGGAVEGPPVIVSLLLADIPAAEPLRRQVKALAETVARVTDRPVANVHIIVEPAARGRIAFGGTLSD